MEELEVCLEIFARLGAKWMNIHPESWAGMNDRRFIIEKNLQSLRKLFPTAQKLGVELMIENLPGSFNTVSQLSELFDPLPELGLHLDIGHTNLLVEHNTTAEILETYGLRLRHVHLHDNKGGSADLHLPLGAGTIELKYQLQLLQSIGYEGTITLEVFTPDKYHVAYSRNMLLETWDELARSSAPRNFLR